MSEVILLPSRPEAKLLRASRRGPIRTSQHLAELLAGLDGMEARLSGVEQLGAAMGPRQVGG
jgi:hypothetical protein